LVTANEIKMSNVARTLTELAQKLGVNASTIRNYRNPKTNHRYTPIPDTLDVDEWIAWQDENDLGISDAVGGDPVPSDLKAKHLTVRIEKDEAERDMKRLELKRRRGELHAHDKIDQLLSRVSTQFNQDLLHSLTVTLPAECAGMDVISLREWGQAQHKQIMDTVKEGLKIK
jgi:transcriptional regulator with XRE-family HTH domain